MKSGNLVCCGLLFCGLLGNAGESWKLVWEEQTFEVPVPSVQTIRGEKHDYFPYCNTAGVWYASGTDLKKSIANAADIVSVHDGDGRELKSGRDYVYRKKFARIGLATPDAKVKKPVVITYTLTPQRLDSIVKDAAGNVSYRVGVPAGKLPRQPELKPGEERLANLYIPVGCRSIAEAKLMPVEKNVFKAAAPCADALLPVTMRKLRSGEPLKILAWGDSVTEGYDELARADRWQEQFVRALRQRFPQAKIELVTKGWGGHNSGNFLNAPASDSRHHYPTAILGSKPDLVISEFVNDSWLNKSQFDANYGRIRNDFRREGIEWLLIAPHHIAGMQNIDGNDRREYVILLRKFASENRLPLADVSDRYSRLYRIGIPYLTLMVNHFNHPDARGMKIFADTLLELFPSR